ncbi:MAG: ATP-dependent Clp protease proteolytic subunit [Lachnospiraceae bacterium]|nr:ATP-dependent Clp protease proteolytic subunit [Lachnospiraceae bacterium]
MEQNQSETKNDKILEMGQLSLPGPGDSRIHLLSIIGEIEGHENLPSGSKTTKYEHVLPQLAYVEDSSEIEGLLLLENSMGGDCSAGLAIAEMIASLSKPTVSLVIGDSHSIGLPLAVAADYSFIVPSGTIIIHPVRMSGTVIGAPQTYDYIKIIQDRITKFISDHCAISEKRLEELMMETGMLTKDVGTILVGKEAVSEGIISEIGGISQALKKLRELIAIRQKEE